MQSQRFEDGSSIEWVDRETLRYEQDGYAVLIWVDFEPGLFSSGRILKASSIMQWTQAPEGASTAIDADQRRRIIERVQRYYRDRSRRLTVAD